VLACERIASSGGTSIGADDHTVDHAGKESVRSCLRLCRESFGDVEVAKKNVKEQGMICVMKREVTRNENRDFSKRYS
jgi:hypothetical protein